MLARRGSLSVIFTYLLLYRYISLKLFYIQTMWCFLSQMCYVSSISGYNLIRHVLFVYRGTDVRIKNEKQNFVIFLVYFAHL